MVLGYYISLAKQFFAQAGRKFKYRRSNYIGKRSFITAGTVMAGNNRVGDDCRIGDCVSLGENVKVGNRSIISRLTIGDNSRIETGVICTGSGEGTIRVGNESYIGIYNILDFSDTITIGDFVHLAGPSTALWTHTSAAMCLNGIPLKQKDKKFRPTAPITIEDNVYIGGNCTVYPGVTVGHHSIIAPNSAVTEDVQPYTQVGGVPAKFIKKLQE